MTIATITIEPAVVAVASFDAKGLAEALKNKKARAIQVIETGRARDRDGYSASEVAAFVNGYLDSDEQVTAARFGDGAIKNLIATYRFLQEWDIIEEGPTTADGQPTAALIDVTAKALNVIEKGQSLATEAARVAIDAIDAPTDNLKAVLGALAEANQMALDIRAGRLAIEADDTEPEGDEESTDDEAEPTNEVDDKESLVRVILRNLASLDTDGVTDDEANELMDAFDLIVGKLTSRA